MANIQTAANCFLAVKRIGVAGVSRAGDTAANVIYKKLRELGKRVIPVNPHAELVEGDHCYPNLASIDGGIDALVIAAPPEATLSLVRQCISEEVKMVWIHRSFGRGSMDSQAVELCKANEIAVIPGSCPMMFCEPVDRGHRCMRWVQRAVGGQAVPSGFS